MLHVKASGKETNDIPSDSIRVTPNGIRTGPTHRRVEPTLGENQNEKVPHRAKPRRTPIKSQWTTSKAHTQRVNLNAKRSHVG